jgi:hypothetical protein
LEAVQALLVVVIELILIKGFLANEYFNEK